MLIERHFPGHELRVVEQHQEADLFFEAVSRQFPDQHIVAMDIGGGSVQVVEGRYSSKAKRPVVTAKYNLASGTYKLQQRYSPRNDVISDGLDEAEQHVRTVYTEVGTQAPVLVFGSTCMLDFITAAGVETETYTASTTHSVSVQLDELVKLLDMLKTLEPENRTHLYPDGEYFMYGADYLLLNVLAAARQIQPQHIIPTNLNSSYAFI
jgi:exopolyphosphatase/pppGpp-phosphohydrolase